MLLSIAMSGHSKWSTIKRQKGVADAKRGQIFTKIANAITIATRSGGLGDPDANPRLRMVLEGAKKVNMPKENIQRAIDRGLGKLPGQSLEEVIFEGFGPGGVAFYLEGVTDNRLRTSQEIKSIFERSGGSLGGQGSTAYMFDKKGEIKVVSRGRDMDEEMLELIDLGAEDVEDYKDSSINGLVREQIYLVYINSLELNTMSKKITQMGYKVESSEIVYKPNVFVQVIDQEIAKKLLDLADKLEEHDDIQKVYANFDILEEIIK